MLSWTLGDTFPMVQGGAWWAAHALGVVRKTGGAGQVTGVADALLNVETCTTVRNTFPVFKQVSRV